LFNKFVGLADLGYSTDATWKTFPDEYATDGDNYLDLCLVLAKTDKLADITSVSIQENTVFPLRGTGKNIPHKVAVEHPKDTEFPYAIYRKTMSTKMFWYFTSDIIQIFNISSVGSIAAVGLPLAGVGIGVGLLFAQSYA